MNWSEFQMEIYALGYRALVNDGEGKTGIKYVTCNV